MLRKLLRSEFRAPALESSNRIEMEKENHLYYGIKPLDWQVSCSARKLRPHETKLIGSIFEDPEAVLKC